MIGPKKVEVKDIDVIKKKIKFLKREIEEYYVKNPKDVLYTSILKNLELELSKTTNCFNDAENPKPEIPKDKKPSRSEILKLHIRRLWLYLPSFRQMFIAFFGPIIGNYFHF